GLGYLWLVSPGSVFIAAAGIATASFVLSLLIPRHPEPGYETVFQRPILPAPAE
ncbi:MFS transporter, partial [Marinovum sp. 1_MG-2023]|nr:MFS transporter [Marinovum sp. 1_MG-2023]